MDITIGFGNSQILKALFAKGKNLPVYHSRDLKPRCRNLTNFTTFSDVPN